MSTIEFDELDKSLQFSNLQEDEFAQMHSLHLQMDAVTAFRLAQEKQSKFASAHECVECGAVIPEGRRKAVPGVQLCVDCQSELE